MSINCRCTPWSRVMQRYEKVAAIVTIGGDWVSWMRQLRRFMQHNPRAVAHPCFPPPPRPLSTNQSIHRHKILLFSHDIFFFCIAKKKKERKSLRPMLLWPTEWVHGERNIGIGYTNGLCACGRARQNTESEPLWRNRPFLCLSCVFFWRRMETGE